MKRPSQAQCPVGAIDVVCDPGAGSIKAGLVGDELPRVEISRFEKWEEIQENRNQAYSGGV